MNPKISIIIPVYNAAATIIKCIESIQNQNLSELEIICIDDGSNDNSLELLKELTNSDSRIITLVNSKRLGPGKTRNIGLVHAKGEAIRFIDADDQLPSNCLKFQYNYLRTNNLQAVKGAYIRTTRENEQVSVKLLNKGFIVNKSNASDQQIELLLYDHWCYMYDHKFLQSEKLSYPEFTNAQDSVFVQNCISRMRRFAYIPSIVYQYNFNPSSVIRKKEHPIWFENIFREKLNLFETLSEMKREKLAVKMLYDAFKNYFDKSIFPGLVKLHKADSIKVLEYLASELTRLRIDKIMCVDNSPATVTQQDDILELVERVSYAHHDSNFEFLFNRYV